MQRMAILHLALIAVSHSQVQADITVEPVTLEIGNWYDAQGSSGRPTQMRTVSDRNPRSPSIGISPWFDVSSNDGSGFYLFYNQVNVKDCTAQYVIQVVTRTSTVATESGASSTETSVLVEALKLDNGRFKVPDQHYGSFSIGENKQRSIHKRFQVGVPKQIGKSPVKTGDWKWDSSTNYQLLHSYDEPTADAPVIEFAQSVSWDMSFVINSSGAVEFAVPELGLAASVKVPDRLATSGSDSSEPQLQLVPGNGICGSVQVEETTIETAETQLGAARATYPLGNGKCNVLLPGGVIAHVGPDGVVDTLMTAVGSSAVVLVGDHTIRLNESRDNVVKWLGTPANASLRDQVHAYRGLMVWFEADRVSKLVVFRESNMKEMRDKPTKSLH